MTSTDEKNVTQFVVALSGPHNETERATPCSVPRRPPRAVKAATRRSRDGLRPAWTAECCAAVSAHPIFLSEKWGFFRLSLERNTLSMIVAFVLRDGWVEFVHRAGVRVMVLAAERMAKRRFLRDRLRVTVVELALRIDVHAAMCAIVLVGLYFAVRPLPGEVLSLLRGKCSFDWRAMSFEGFV